MKECPNCKVQYDDSTETVNFCTTCGSKLVLIDFLIGETIGKGYKIKKLIKTGGQGIIYEGERKIGNEIQRIAIKVLKPELIRQDPYIVDRFKTEAGVHVHLNSEHDITIFDMAEDKDLDIIYIAMEYVEGKTLKEILQEEGKLQLSRISKIVYQICKGLGGAHKKGIIHRDIKPSNIMITEDDGEEKVKLIDYGIAKIISGEISAFDTATVLQFPGTIAYMSPEHYEKNSLCPASDLFSLGVVVYEMMTGKLPFLKKGEESEATTSLRRILEGKFLQSDESNSKSDYAIPKNFWPFFKKAFEPNLSDRYQTCNEFWNGFEKAYKGKKEKKKERKSIWIFTYILIVILSFLIGYYYIF